VNTDQDTGQTIIAGMGELHLEIVVDRLQREFGVGANVGKPQVAYRETISKASQGEGRFVRQTGGRGQYGHVKIRLEPTPDKAYEFVNGTVGGTVPKEFIGPAEKGIVEALEGGILAGFPMSNVKVTIYDGSYHDVDSSEMAFKIAGSMALKDAAKKARPVLLEPVMSVEVVVPDEYMGPVNGDLISRRGRLEGMELKGATQIIRAMVPLSEMFGYATEIRSRTQGRGSFSMHFGRYEEAPASVTEEVVKRMQGQTDSK
jgi:elongation factor G